MRSIVLFVASILTAHAAIAYEEPLKIRIATTADSYPYNYGVADGCMNPSGVCGFEIDLFNEICGATGMSCEWVIVPWVDDPNGTPGNVADNVLVFDVLTKAYADNKALSQQTKDDIQKAYGDIDAVVASADAKPSRRKEMLFTAKYYTAKHLFVAAKGSGIQLSTGVSGVQKYFPENNQKLKIGTWTGFLFEELQRAYGKNPGFIELVEIEKLKDNSGNNYNDPMKALVDGKIDAAFVYTGIETKYVMSGAYEVVQDQLIGFINEDPFAGVAAAMNISKRGRLIEERFNDGLVKVRKAGIYEAISKKWFGYDIWECELGPQIQDPFCAK